MKVLITGGSGFTGRAIFDAMPSRYDVLAPKHKELELLDEDAVRKFFKENKIDVVVHAAIKPVHRNAKDLSDLVKDNLRIFFNVARNSSYFKKMVYIGSGAIYDSRYYLPKMKEEYFGEHVPIDDTGLFKYAAAKYIEKSDNIVELRAFGVFGKYEDYSIRFISNMICKAIFDLPLTMKQNRKFDYLCGDDLGRVVEYFIDNKAKYKAYNVTPDKSVELYQLAELALKISGKKLPIVAAKEGMGVEYSGDNSRLRAEIPGLKFTPIEVAVKKLYSWYEDNKDKIDRNLLLVDK
jgi:GDP-L-fucose synthase